MINITTCCITLHSYLDLFISLCPLSVSMYLGSKFPLLFYFFSEFSLSSDFQILVVWIVIVVTHKKIADSFVSTFPLHLCTIVCGNELLMCT